MERSNGGLTRRGFLIGAGAGAASLALGLRAAEGAGAKGPNVLFLMSDQHRWDFLHCAGHPLAPTPNLDRLAGEGVRFDAAYCQAPVCVPARMSIITGRYPHSHGALANTYALPQDQKTIGHHFKEHGYQTGAVGKMHFIDPDQQHGFDYRVERADYLQAHPDFPPAEDKPGEAEGTAGGISPQSEEQTYENYLADRAIEWLEKNGSRPFCLWLSFIAPHPPFYAPKPLYDLYAGKVRLPEQPPVENPDLGQQQRRWTHLDEKGALAIMTAYLGRITLVDRNVGRVLAALQRLGLAEDTIVTYTADHGDMEYEHRLFGKGVGYDGAARIPFFVRWPGRVQKGRVRREIVEHVDLFPTLCELAGLPVPATVQGRSLAPLLRGDAAGWPNTAFAELNQLVMVRTERYKCDFYDGRPRELYDLEQDPREWQNLVGRPGSDTLVAEMTKLRDDWMKRTTPDLRGQVQPFRVGRPQRQGGRRRQQS